MYVSPVKPQTLANTAHKEWVKYFNSHLPFLTKTDSSGFIHGARRTSFDDMGVKRGIKKEVRTAVKLHEQGKFDASEDELARVEMAYPFNNVREAFYSALDKLHPSNETKKVRKIRKK